MAALMVDARAAWAGGDMTQALWLARSARDAAPGAPGPAFLLCVLLLECQEPEANALIETLETFRDFAPGWDELGHTLSKRQPAAARVAFGRAAEAYAARQAVAPSADIACRLGRTLRELGQLVSARAAMEWSTVHDPAAPRAWFSLGLVCQDLHDQSAAIHAFRTALDLQPGFHEAAFNLGVACQENGVLEAALDAYATAWRLRPDSFGRIAQALVSPGVGRLWLHPSALRRELASRA